MLKAQLKMFTEAVDDVRNILTDEFAERFARDDPDRLHRSNTPT